MHDNNADLITQLMEIAIERMKTAGHPGLHPQDVEDAELELRGFVSQVRSGMIPKELIPSRIDRLTRRVFKAGVDSIENHIGYLRMAIDQSKPGFHRELEKTLPMDHFAHDAKLMEVYIDPEIEKNATFGFKHAFYDRGINDLDSDSRVVSEVDTIPSQNIRVSRIARKKIFNNPNQEDIDNHYFVSHDADGKIHHVLKFNQENLPDDSSVREILVSKNPTSEIPTSEFYGHLLNNDINILSDDSHSEGAKKLWDHLQGLGYGHKVLNSKDNSEAYGISDPYQKKTFRTKDTKNTKHLRYLFKPVYPDYMASGPKPEGFTAANSPDTSGVAPVTEEFLDETFLVNSVGKKEDFGHGIFFGHNGIHDARDYLQHFHREHKIGNIGDHLNVSHFKSTDNRGGYFMTHDANGVVHHVAQYDNPYKENPDTVRIHALTKNPKAYHTSDAAELYSHLIKHQKLIIQSDDTHSAGGLDTWKKLARKTGIAVHAWDTYNDKPVNSDVKLRDVSDTHVSPLDFHRANSEGGLEKKNAQHVGHHIVLIAHEK